MNSVFLNGPTFDSRATQTDMGTRLAPTLQVLDAERQRQAAKCRTAAIVCVVIALVGALLVVGATGGRVSYWIIAPLLLAGIIYTFVAGGAKKAYADGFKTMVMPALVSAFGELHFTPNSGLGESEFNRANLFPSPDRYSSEDLITGRIGETSLRFSEVHAEERRTTTDGKGNTRTHYVTIFRGLFFIADFNKNFVGTTYIVPEGISGSLGRFGKSIQSLGGKMAGRGQLVQLEDPEFERQFVVYSSDQTEARYILSSSLMRRYLALEGRFGGEVSAAFLGGSLYLMVASGQNWFEPPSLSTPLTMQSLGPVLSQLQLTTGMVQNLDLNTRVWSKT